MKGIYLGSNRARHFNYNIIYQDIEKDKYDCDIGGDMLLCDLSEYDFIIATPPCNFWSKANPYWRKSYYSQLTRHLLPDMIIKLGFLDKPFIIENVINKKRFEEFGIFNIIRYFNLNIYYVGRHMYITNIEAPLILGVPQQQDFKYGGVRINKDGYNQGGQNVFNVIEKWLEILYKKLEKWQEDEDFEKFIGDYKEDKNNANN